MAGKKYTSDQMMNLGRIIAASTIKGVESIYGTGPHDELIQLQKTKKEFEGDITIVVFPLLEISHQKPEVKNLLSQIHAINRKINIPILNDTFISSAKNEGRR